MDSQDKSGVHFEIKEEIISDDEKDGQFSNFASVYVDSGSEVISTSYLKNSDIGETSSIPDPLKNEFQYTKLECAVNEPDLHPDEHITGNELKEDIENDLIKNEVEWKDEIHILDDHVQSLSDSPRKRTKELKRLIQHEAEERAEDRYSFRKKARIVENRLGQKPTVENAEKPRLDENIWSDDSDNDPDYNPCCDEYQEKEKEKPKKYKKRKRLKTKCLKPNKTKRFRKPNACYYCNRKFTNILRHLLVKHSSESEVKAIIDLPVGNKRNTLFEDLRLKGNLNYNEEEDRINSEIREKRLEIRRKKTEERRKKIEEGSYIPKMYRRDPYGTFKKHCCLYCKRRYEKIARHFKAVHKDEPEVKHFLSFPLRSKERLSAIQIITNKGNFFYNREVIANNEGNIITKRRQKTQTKPENFLPCNYCWGFYKKRLLNKHILNCPLNRNTAKGNLQIETLVNDHLEENETKSRVSLLDKMDLEEEPQNKIKDIGKDSLIHIPFEKDLKCKNLQQKSPLDEGDINKCQDQMDEISSDNDDSKYSEVSNLDYSPLGIIKNLIKGNLIGEESTIDLKVSKRVSKRSACYFCGKLIIKLLPHFTRKHRDELHIKHILALEKGSRERFNAIQIIRWKANFLHNKKIANNKNEVLLTKRLSHQRNKKHIYLPCEFCFAFFSRRTLMQHTYNCQWSNIPDEIKKKEIAMFSEKKRFNDVNKYSSVLLYCPTNSSETVKQLVLSLENRQKLISLIKNDLLISKFGAYLTERSKFSRRLIIYKMRCLARLVLIINVLDNSVKTLHDSFKAEKLETVLKACLQLCVSLKKSPLLTEEFLRTSIRYCCMIIKSDCLIEKNDESLQEINNFLALIRERWLESLLLNSSCVLRSRENINFQREIQILQTNNDTKITVNLTHKNDDKSEKETLKCKDCNGLHECKNGCTNTIDNLTDIFDDREEETLGKVKTVTDRNTSEIFPDYSGNIEHLSTILYTKKNVCLFCGRSYRNLVKHWNLAHISEPEIRKLQKLEKNSEERKLFIKSLRNRGNLLHNRKVIEKKSGFVIPMRGRASDKMYNEYLPCEHCFGLFRKKAVMRHSKVCPLSPFQGQHDIMSYKNYASLMLYEYKGKSTTMHRILEHMKNDELKRILCKDDLILKCGQMVCDMNRTKQKVCFYTSRSMRDLANILAKAHQYCSEINSLRECFHSKSFSFILRAAKDISVKKSSRKAALRYFKSLRFLIYTCCRFIKNENSVNNKDENNADLLDFMRSLHRYWVLSDDDLKHFDEDKIISQRDNPESADLDESAKKGNINEKKHYWTSEESKILQLHFSNHIKNHIIPGKSEIESCIKENNVLKSRGWVAVKSKLNNLIRPKKKRFYYNPFDDTIQEGTSSKEIILDSSSGKFIYVQVKDNTVISNVSESKETKQTNLSHLTVNSHEENHLPLNKHSVRIEEYDRLEDKIGNEERTCHLLDSYTYQGQFENYLQKDMSEDEDSSNSLVSKYKKKGINREWSQEETEIIKRYFSENISKRQLPSKYECQDCIEENKCLSSRNWISVKSKINNLIKSQQKHELKAMQQNQLSDLQKVTRNSLNNSDYLGQVEEFSDAKANQSNNNTYSLNTGNKSRKTKTCKSNVSKQQWTLEETEIIETFFKNQISNYKVPGKKECEQCMTENSCLSSRSWVTIKSKVHNIIVSKKSKEFYLR